MARDPLRRKISREAQNERRKLQRRVNSLRKYAAKEKNAAVKKAYQREAKNLQAVIKRSAISRGASLTEANKKLEKLQAYVQKPTAQANQDLLVKNEMKRAMDLQNSTLFGSGREARARVKAFFMFYSDDWIGSVGDRYEAIKQRHPGMSLFDLYEAMTKAGSVTGYSFEEYIADYLGIDYSNVDTSDPAWKRQIMEEYDKLDSPLQKSLAVAYARLRSR